MQSQAKISAVISAVLFGKSATFAQIEYLTQVKTSAKFKDVLIEKHTTANVQLFSNIKAATDVFLNAVKRSAEKLGEDVGQIEAFQSSGNYFEHTECYSVVKHKENEKLYLWAIFNNAISHYLIEGKPATKEQVAEYLTPAAKKTLLAPPKITYNVTNDLQHTVKIRTIALDNILKIKAAKTEITFN